METDTKTQLEELLPNITWNQKSSWDNYSRHYPTIGGGRVTTRIIEYRGSSSDYAQIRARREHITFGLETFLNLSPDYKGPKESFSLFPGEQEHPDSSSQELAETVFFTAQSSYRKVQASKVWNGLKEAWSGIKGWMDNYIS